MAQASVLLLFQYAATLSMGKGPDVFQQSEWMLMSFSTLRQMGVAT